MTPGTSKAAAVRSPLARAAVTTILPVRDLDRARRYYVDALGLAFDGKRADGWWVLRAGVGCRLALLPRPEGTTAGHTALSFAVDDIVSAIRALEERGVAFHDYDLPGFGTVGHVCTTADEKAAWFSDPDGNVLRLHETVAPSGKTGVGPRRTRV